VEKHCGEVYFVQLNCNQKELFKRLKHPSRKPFSKIKNQKDLKTKIKGHDMGSVFKHKYSLSIDNTNLSPKKAAERIKEYYKL
jgi:hypothetical protein